MKPYYSHNGIVIYHADCREVLPTLPKVDLVLTDPPYGMSFQSGYRHQKHDRITGDDFLDIKMIEYVISFGQIASYIFCRWQRIPDVIFGERTGNQLHPTEKPTSVLAKLIACTQGSSCLDPWMGSGSTLVAAKHLGHTCIGIEIEKRYCEIAAKRVDESSIFDFPILKTRKVKNKRGMFD